jgi:uncharacterized protein YcbX
MSPPTGSGAILSAWRWPVKSMAGERVNAMRIDGRGAGGDRTHAVLHHHKGEWKPLTVREAPRLLAWAGSYPFAPDGGLDPSQPPFAVVTAPDGHNYRWGDPRLEAALAEDLERPVRLRRDVDGIQDLPRTLLVTTQASLDALGAELGTRIDLRRFRTNLHLGLDAPAWDDLGWQGGELRFEGGVRLKLLHPCERCAIPTRSPDTGEKWPDLLRHLAATRDQCFGINARVVTAGRLAVGEGVAVHAASGSGAFGR